MLVNFEIYCDESQQELLAGDAERRRGKRVVIGGLWIKADSRTQLKEAIKQLREQHQLRGEFKWTRVSPSRQAFYCELVDLFFSAEYARFRALVLPAEELDAVQFHMGDAELMFYKFYYQLLHHWILDSNTYRVFVDTKTNRVGGRLRKLQEVLSSANRLSIIEHVQALPSEEVDLLQLTDVLIGAVSYRFHRRTSSSAKTAVVERVEEHIRHRIGCTGCGEKKLNVFCWQSGGGW
jgi:hypothetical protein